jgi:hypothetical protein
MSTRTLPLTGFALVLALGACAIHPAGEKEERDRAAEVGRQLEEDQAPPPLPDHPTAEDFLRTAFFASADLRMSYWEWRAALERIPQEASPPNPALTFSYLFNPDNVKAWNRTTLGLSNDPMENIRVPSKLSIAGRRALEQARAAGLRFEATKFRVQAEVLSNYYDLALHAELMRIQTERVALAEVVARETAARVESGSAVQSRLVRAETDLDLARNDLENRHAELPPIIAKLNTYLGREPGSDLPLPGEFPELQPLSASDEEILRLAAERSPELAALEHEIGARKEGLELARAAYIPDFGLSFNFTGSVSQALGGMIVLPLRTEAIEGGIEEARALLRAAEAARTQYQRDLAASFILALYLLHNTERQIDLFEKTIVPRARESAQLAGATWAAGRGDQSGTVDSRRLQLDAELMLVELKSQRAKALAAIETWSKLDVEALHPVRMGSSGP